MADISYNQTVSTFSTWVYRSGVRQKPFVIAKELPFIRRSYAVRQKVVWGSAPGFNPVPSFGDSNDARAAALQYVREAVFGSTSQNNLVALAYSRAYNKILSKTGERASLLTALAERKSTYTMVLARLAQLAKGAKALKRGRFREFLATFGIKPKDKHRDNRWSRPRDFSSLWLEYWFGWAPTVGDIANAVDVWQRPIQAEVKLREGSGHRDFVRITTRNTSSYKSTNTIKGSFICSVRCTVTLQNWDLWVANQMGFLNPVRTAWETTPFSWFADWFINIGQILGSYTDTIGVAISDVWMTRFFTGINHTQLYYTYQPAVLGGGEITQQTVYVNRQKLGSLPRPSLVFRIPGISWTRGLTLSSLIVQLFSPTKPVKAR